MGWILGLVCLAALACAPNIQPDPNEASGNDGERGRAQPLPLGEPVIDNVNYIENDMTDWKFVQIDAPGQLTVTLGCDYSGAACLCRVRNAVGQIVETIDPEGEPTVTRRLDVRRGNYYLEILAQAASTEYTIQADYEPN
jgi:hypothetical protein